jgi:hypothetical protein|tara:strand:+ start:159 stop:614 length:456 start_codon:yes stop_codon:yes gene_type:complete
MATTKSLIQTVQEKVRLLNEIKHQAIPFQIAIKEGTDRSLGQNRLLHKWNNEVAKWFGDRDAADVHAENKLHIGVRMLMAENEDFKEQWTRLIKGRFTTEEKLELMSEPTDYPITRIMTTKQMSRFMELVHQKYTSQGLRLTDPEMQKYGE